MSTILTGYRYKGKINDQNCNDHHFQRYFCLFLKYKNILLLLYIINAFYNISTAHILINAEQYGPRISMQRYCQNAGFGQEKQFNRVFHT